MNNRLFKCFVLNKWMKKMDKNSFIWIGGTVLLLMVAFVCQNTYAQIPQNWSSDYSRLKSQIEKNFEKPAPKSPLQVYLQWMEIKAKDRNEVKGLLNEASHLYQQDPNNQELKTWVNRFTQLLNLAQASGEGTVNEAAMLYMYIRSNQCPKCANWSEVIARLKANGRPIYQKATETSFLTDKVISRAKCMINFSIRSVESDARGWGVYRCREGEFGEVDEEGNTVFPDRDFTDVDCEPRSSFHYTSRGEPDKPTDMGLNWIEQVREEARWWKFSDAEQDATELMEEFYKDSMCKMPPNGCDKGHRHYQKLAEQYHLPRAIEYNEGFYATIYGKVEVVSSSGRKPAEEAEVTVKAPLDGESWTGRTDKEGKYEIKKVLLHKECQPFEITARHGQDEAWDLFYGPLEKPDPSYRYEKNLEIRKGDILGRVSVSYDWSGESNTRRWRGSASCQTIGTWRFQPEESYGPLESYRPEPLKVIYSYWERVERTTPKTCSPPQPDCPVLEWELKGSGTLTLPLDPMYDMQHPLGRLTIVYNIPIAGSYYEVGSIGTLKKKTIIPGKKQLSGDCDECRIYVHDEREIVVGSFSLRAALGPHGEMAGSESWTHCGAGGGYGWDEIGFGFNQLPNLLGQNYDPIEGPTRIKGDCKAHGTTRIRAQWNFKKIKK